MNDREFSPPEHGILSERNVKYISSLLQALFLALALPWLFFMIVSSPVKALERIGRARVGG